MRAFLLRGLMAALVLSAAACVVVDDKPRPATPTPGAPAEGAPSEGAPREGAPVIEAQPAAAEASARETLRLGLWRLVAGYDAALAAVSTCSQAGLIPPGALAQIQRLNAEARAAAELVRLSASLAALAPSDGAAAIEAFQPPSFAAPVLASGPVTLPDEPALPPGASGARLAGAVSRLSGALSAGPCAATLLAGRQAVSAQFADWRERGVYVPTAEFDAAIARIDATTFALASQAAQP